MHNHGLHEEFEYTAGNKDAVVLIHGILGSPNQFRTLAEELFKQEFDCKALLLPGHGGTARAFYRTPRGQWESYAKRCVNKAKLEYRRVFLVGLSLGGLISLDCAAEGGIAGVVLINTPLGFRINLNRVTYSMKNMLAHNDAHNKIPIAYKKNCSVSDAKLLEYPLWLGQYARMYLYLHQTQRKLEDVQAKALIVQSSRDESIQRKSAGRLKKLLLNAESEIIELNDSYHGSFSEKDEERLISEVTRFVKRT